MEGTFELNKPRTYTVQASQENDFLNQKLESDQYGIYYSVQFQGDAETYLWQAKTAPVVGEGYYGHIEPSKSGKSLRFKKDKQDGVQASQPYQPKNNNTITLSMIWKTVAQIRGLPENPEELAKFFEIVDEHFTELILMAEKLDSKDKVEAEDN